MKSSTINCDPHRRRGYAVLPLVWLLACCGLGGWLLLPAFSAHDADRNPAATQAGSVPASLADGNGGPPPRGLRAVPIEAVRPGQRAWAYDPAADAWRACEVEEAYERDYAGDMVAVATSGGGAEVVATGNHPFWVAAGEGLDARPSVEELTEQETRGPPGTRGRWVEARHLREGDVLVRAGGERVAVAGLRAWQDRTPVYNLRVAGLHTYAVGELALAVHNNDCPPTGVPSGPKNPTKGVGPIASKTRLSPDEVKDRIHRMKPGNVGGGGKRNPDVAVDDDGEVYPEIPGGGYGDSIGNIYDPPHSGR